MLNPTKFDNYVEWYNRVREYVAEEYDTRLGNVLPEVVIEPIYGTYVGEGDGAVRLAIGHTFTAKVKLYVFSRRQQARQIIVDEAPILVAFASADTYEQAMIDCWVKLDEKLTARRERHLARNS